MTAHTVRSPELRGWHVILIVVGFFGTFMTVDIAMAIKAYATFPGEVTDKPYEEGLAFNRTLSERSEERALGWKAKVDVSAINVGRSAITLTITDPQDAPVRGLSLKARLERPATETGRLFPRFTEIKPGVYQAMAPDTPGAWDLSVSGTDRDGRPFEAERRLSWR